MHYIEDMDTYVKLEKSKLVIIVLVTVMISGLVSWSTTKVYYQNQLTDAQSATFESYQLWNETANSIHSYFGNLTAGIGAGDCNSFQKQALINECRTFNTIHNLSFQGR